MNGVRLIRELMRTVVGDRGREPAAKTAPTGFKYVLIVAYARSGSTLIQKLVSSIDGYHIHGENADALEGLLSSYEHIATAKREQGNLPRSDSGDPWRGVHLLDPDRYLKKLIRLFVEEILQPPADARAVGFKEVRYFDHVDSLAERLELLRRAFHPAVFVFCRRDPVAISTSSWWRSYPQETIIEEVRRFDAIADNFNIRYPNESVVADYDKYRSDIDSLRPLFAVLREPFDTEGVRRIMEVRLMH